MKIILDGENCIMGRLASYAVKQALIGKDVDIVNVDKVFITGNKVDILETYINMRQKGKAHKQKGPYFPTTSERIMKRAIRGMIKYKEGRGKIAFKKIKCYKGMPEALKNAQKVSEARLEGNKKGIYLSELSSLLRGGK